MTPFQRSLAVALVFVQSAGIVLAASSSPDLRVEAPPGLETVAEEVRLIGRDDFSGALRLTGVLGFTSPIQVFLAPDEGEIARRTPGWISGFADGEKSSIVLFPDRVSTYPDNNLRTLVHHEVAHVLVARAARGRPVPRWFNEGLATVAAREWGLEDRARYATAVVGRGPRTTAELDAAFAAGGRRVVRAYALSGAMIRWLRLEYGEFVTVRILEMLGRDIEFSEAFVRTTGNTVAEAEHRFFVTQALWHTWVPFVTSTGALWAAITALALVAIRRRRSKSAAMREQWRAEEEEEEMLREVRGRSDALRPLDFTRKSSLDDTDDEVVN